MRAELCAACHSPAQPMSVMLHLQEEEKRTFFQKEFVKDNSETPQEMIKMYNVDTGGTKVTATFVGWASMMTQNVTVASVMVPQCQVLVVDRAQCHPASIIWCQSLLWTAASVIYDVPVAGGVARYDSGCGGHDIVSHGYTPLVSVPALDTGQ